MTAYQTLTRRFERIATIQEAISMLGWDEAAVMPPRGAAARADQMAVLAGLAHGMLTNPVIQDELASAEGVDALSGRNLALMRRAHRRAAALPADLVEALTRAASLCEKTWREARRQSDFALVAAPLRELVALVSQSAVALGEALGMTPYDALMDEHQPGIGAARAGAAFDRYEAFLAEALPRAEAAQARRQDVPPGSSPFREAAQEALCRRLAAMAGLDFGGARLDRSTHPFCGGTPTDIRITTRYDESDFAVALMGVLHETGHALYEAGLPRALSRQPAGYAAGMAVHESQSLIIEMQAARSDAYLSWLGPALGEAFRQPAEDFSLPRLKARLRHVERGFIRVEADELTYPAHVMLRFRLEQALVAGDLDVADLPGAWNDGLEALLGRRPPDDASGCLQDIHWYSGGFGYFPSYTLGAMAAAQLMAAARQSVPDLDEALRRGDFAPLLGWLRVNVHSHGALLGFDELLDAATGEALNPAAFEAHLTQRYLG